MWGFNKDNTFWFMFVSTMCSGFFLLLIHVIRPILKTRKLCKNGVITNGKIMYKFDRDKCRGRYNFRVQYIVKDNISMKYILYENNFTISIPEKIRVQKSKEMYNNRNIGDFVEIMHLRNNPK